MTYITQVAGSWPSYAGVIAAAAVVATTATTADGRPYVRAPQGIPRSNQRFHSLESWTNCWQEVMHVKQSLLESFAAQLVQRKRSE